MLQDCARIGEACIIRGAIACWIIGGAAIALLTYQTCRYADYACDFVTYYTAAKIVVSSQPTQVYDVDFFDFSRRELFPQIHHGVMFTAIPPFALPFTMPLVLVPPEWARQAWEVFLALAIGYAFGSLWAQWKPRKSQLALLFALTAIMGPVWVAIKLGQMAPLLLAWYTTALWLLTRNRPFLASIPLTLCLVKPLFVLPLLAYLVGGQRYRTSASVFVCALGLIGWSCFFMGPSIYSAYLHLIQTTMTDPDMMRSYFCPTIRGQLELLRIPLSNDLINLLGCIYLVTLIGLAFLGWFFRERRNFYLFGVLSSIPLGIVTAPYFQHYDCILLIPFLFALCEVVTLQRPPTWWIVCVCTLIVPFLQPVNHFLMQEYIYIGGMVSLPTISLALISILICYLLSPLSRCDSDQAAQRFE